MIGLLFFFCVIMTAIIRALDDERLRKESRNRAAARGEFDYIDYKGRRWFGDARARVNIVDGHEYLVDYYDPNHVFIDITAEKEAKKYKNSVQRIFDEYDMESKERSLKECIGSYDVSGGYRIEMSTGKYMKIFCNGQNYIHKQYYNMTMEQPSERRWYTRIGDDIKISKEEYCFLTGNDFGYCDQIIKGNIEDRKKYAMEHGLADIMHSV